MAEHSSGASAQPGRAPFVLIPCDNRTLGGHPFYVLGRKYADALQDAAGCHPLLLPSVCSADLTAYLDLADGVLLTGSPANVHPMHFGQTVRDPQLPLDQERDQVTLPLVRLSVQRGLPLFAICRGLQEINVALGGTLLQAVHEEEGRFDHRADPHEEPDAQYGPSHPVDIVAGSELDRILGARQLQVNSLHGQAIDRLAPGLRVEARAPDGTVEAVHISAHPGFALAVQWHPEWRVMQNPASRLLFGAFGDACREAQARRAGRGGPAGLSRAA
ncbi:MAG TPA: gamma-glutamyl-gamma-aminobutyrate hydrolase family protein [Burkholderiaceae bacterium]|nr:gamma-glutamyl-gamma-aminobutyrate hydrolase family protein [Burkholderiaceae bacterium]